MSAAPLIISDWDSDKTSFRPELGSIASAFAGVSEITGVVTAEKILGGVGGACKLCA
jgi:hypothetical protein